MNAARCCSASSSGPSVQSAARNGARGIGDVGVGIVMEFAIAADGLYGWFFKSTLSMAACTAAESNSATAGRAPAADVLGSGVSA